MGHTYRDVFAALVVDVNDPEKRGRIKVKSGALLAEGTDYPDWIEPAFPYAGNSAGWFAVPPVESAVEIEIVTGSSEDDSPGEAFAIDAQPRWRCGLYKTTEDVPEDLAKNYPQRVGIATPGGQVLVFDDKLSETIMKFGKLRLGGDASDQPLVLGTVFLAFAGALIDAIASHFHMLDLSIVVPALALYFAPIVPPAAPPPVGAGPSTTPPLNAAAFLALKASPITDRVIVSDVAFTQKKA